MPKRFLVLVVASLSACTASTTTPPGTTPPGTTPPGTTPPGTTPPGTTPPGASPKLAPASFIIGDNTLDGIVPSDNSTVVISVAGVPISGVAKSLNLTQGTFGGAFLVNGAANNTFDVIAFSDDGKPSTSNTAKVEATIIGTSTNAVLGTTFGQVVRYGRLVQTVMPVSGGGTWQGNYRGTYGSASAGVNGSANGGIIGVRGDATLNVTFGSGSSGTIDGSITNRSMILANTDLNGVIPANQFGDVTLSQTSISDQGSFSGTATGGAMNSQTVSSSSGTYQGLFAGSFGETIVGSLQFDNVVGGNTFTELGVFTADKQ